jgi:hydrogenase/urease accessory protein HupE
MKKVLLTIVEPTTATLLIAFGIGLGMAVHPVFFLAALLIAIAALIQSLVNAAGHLTYRHP